MSRSMLLIVCLALSAPALAEDKPYVIGIEPTLSASTAAEQGQALAQYLAGALNHPFSSHVYQTYDALAQGLASGEIDFAWINPYAFVKASRKANIMAVAKALRHGEAYRSVFFVKADSKVHTLQDLKGLRVAWVDPISTAGYLFPQALLIENKLDPTTIFVGEAYAGSHKGVCEAVLSGAVDVGATFHTGNDPASLVPDGCVTSLGPDISSKLRGIAMSDPIPSEVIAARPKLDMDYALKVGGVFAAMSENPKGKDILKSVFHADGFGLALDSDFVPVRNADTEVSTVRLSEDEADVAGTFGDDKSPEKKKRKKTAPPTIHLTPHHSDN